MSHPGEEDGGGPAATTAPAEGGGRALAIYILYLAGLVLAAITMPVAVVMGCLGLFKRGTPQWVRPGVCLYGATPFPDATAASYGLRAAMTLTSEIIGVQSVSAGGTVGYGATFRADRRMRVGVVACGYADGYPRHAPTGTPITVAGVPTRVVGRVSMDMITVDLDPVPNAGIGAPVVLWGEGGPSVDEVAQAAGTLGYELMCALAPRVRVQTLSVNKP